MPKIIELKCEQCGKKFEKVLSIYNNDKKRGVNAGKYCSRKCYYKSPSRKPNLGKFGKNSTGWKGGRIYERGYKMVIANDHPNGILKGGGNKYVREHRLIMEKHLGRYLTKNEVIHHMDGNPLNNKIDNLAITDNSRHMKHHSKNYWEKYHKEHPIIIVKCIDCLKVITKRSIRCQSCAKKGDLNPRRLC